MQKIIITVFGVLAISSSAFAETSSTTTGASSVENRVARMEEMVTRVCAQGEQTVAKLKETKANAEAIAMAEQHAAERCDMAKRHAVERRKMLEQNAKKITERNETKKAVKEEKKALKESRKLNHKNK